jgi:signal transduction histidine kinase
MSSFEQAVLSMLLVGLAAGSVATAAGYRPIFLAYVIPTLGPLAVLWAISPTLRDVGWVPGLMSLVIVLFGLVLNALARDTYNILRNSYEIRLEREGLNKGLTAALEVAEAANRAKTRFLASASHDLRQPMQTLSLFAGALALRPLDERSRSLVGHINEALVDLTAELDALLDISKLDAGTVEVQCTDFPLAPLLERIHGVFRAAAEQKGLGLKVQCDESVWVSVDRRLLERVIRNLVENAIKYTEAGTVQIAVTRGNEYHWTLQVADTGCGIPEAEHPRVFEEFYQIQNPERDRRRGLGLGLAIVKRLADLLGLTLSMKSALGEGTQFEISLPLGTPIAATVVSQISEALDPGSPALKVLVIDDEESLRLALRALLEEAGFVVEVASGTDEALELLRRMTLDVVVADFRLRGEDSGLKAINVLRCVQPDLPALLMTGETAPDRLREAQQSGIAMIHKPVTPKALLREIEKLVQTNSGSDFDEQRHGSSARR